MRNLTDEQIIDALKEEEQLIEWNWDQEDFENCIMNWNSLYGEITQENVTSFLEWCCE